MSGVAVTLDLPSVPASVPAARRAIGRLADRIDPEVLQSAQLLVSELVTNSVRHSGVGPQGVISLRATVEPNHLRIQVCDQGPGFEVPGLAEAPVRGSGWGLYLVGQLADRWGLLPNDGSCVWFEMVLTRGRPRASEDAAR